MRLLKKLTLILIALLLMLVILGSGAGLVAWTFDDEDWRRFSIVMTRVFTPYQLTLGGEFSLTLEHSIKLEATEITLIDDETRDTFRIASAGIEVDPSVLWYGTLLFEQLNLSDVNIDLYEKEYDEDSGSIIILPLVELAVVQRLAIDYHQIDTSDPVSLRIDRITMSNQGREEMPVEVQATGSIEDESFSISGFFGSIIDLNSEHTSYPINVSFQMPSLEFSAIGMLEDPLEGEGLDLNLVAKSTRPGHLLNLFNIDFPDGDAFLFEAVAHHSLRNPQLRDLALKVTHNENTVLELNGEVNDLWSPDIFTLAYNASIPPPSSLFRYLSETSFGLELVEVNGLLSRDHEEFRVESYSVTTSFDTASKILLEGTLDASIDGDSGDLSAANVNLTATVLDSGAETGEWHNLLSSIQTASLQLSTTHQEDRFRVRDVQLDVHSHGGDRLSLSGAIQKLTHEGAVSAEGIDLDILFETDDLEKSMHWFDIAVPKVGQVRIESALEGHSDELYLSEFRFDSLNQHGMKLDIQGSARLGDFRKQEYISAIEMTITGDQLNPFSLNDAFGLELSGDGNFKLEADLSAADNHIVVGDISLTNLMHQVDIKAQGEATIPVLRESGADIHLDYSVNAVFQESRRLFETLGFSNFPGIGSLHYNLVVIGALDNLSLTISDFRLGDEEFMQLSGAGTMEHVNALDDGAVSDMEIQLQLIAASTASLGDLFDTEVADYGQLLVDAKVSYINSEIGIESLDARIMEAESLKFRMTGKVDGRFETPEINWQGNLLVDLDYLLDREKIIPDPDWRNFEGSFSLSEKNDAWRVEALSLKSLESGQLEIRAHESSDDVPRPYERVAQLTISLGDSSYITGDTGAYSLRNVPVNLNSEVFFRPGEFRLQGDLTLAGNAGNTDLNLDYSGESLVISSRVKFSELDISDLANKNMLESGSENLAEGAVTETRTDSQTTKAVRDRGDAQRRPLFSEKQIDWSFLDSLNFDLDVDIGTIVTGDVTVHDFETDISIKDNTLTLDPFIVRFNNGLTKAKMSLSTAAPSPAFTIEITSDDMPIGPLISQLQLTPAFRGMITAILSLSSHGTSPREMISNLNGYAGFVIEEGEVERRLLDMFATDYLNWTLSSTVRRQRFADIDCFITRFNVSDGVLRSEVMLSETPFLLVTGGGELNLVDESIDVTLLPRKKKQLFTAVTPVNIRGDLRDPGISAVPARAASKEIAGYTLIPQIYLPVRALGYLYSMISTDKGPKSECLDLNLYDDPETAVEKN